MRRFILRSNIERFERRLNTETDPGTVAQLMDMLAAERRALALLDAAEFGARPDPSAPAPARAPAPAHSEQRPAYDAEAFAATFHASAKALLLLDPGPGLRILDINAAFEELTGSRRGEVAGRPLFEAYPENPDHVRADGVSKLADSLRIAAETGRPHAMPLQRYDVRGEDGVFVARHWLPVNAPVFDTDGHLLYLMQEVEEVAVGAAV